MAMQVKLLRVLQNRELCMVGSSRTSKVNVRIIAASNKDILSLIKKGVFREDLFFRLNIINVDIPPLRERNGDIALLTSHFTAKYAKDFGKIAPEFSDKALQVLTHYYWPGNVRELENVIEQAVLFSDGAAITPGNLPPNLATAISVREDMDFFNIPLPQAHERLERQYLQEMLDRTGGNVAEAARQAGISRQHFYQKMKRYNLSRG